MQIFFLRRLLRRRRGCPDRRPSLGFSASEGRQGSEATKRLENIDKMPQKAQNPRYFSLFHGFQLLSRDAWQLIHAIIELDPPLPAGLSL